MPPKQTTSVFLLKFAGEIYIARQNPQNGFQYAGLSLLVCTDQESYQHIWVDLAKAKNQEEALSLLERAMNFSGENAEAVALNYVKKHPFLSLFQLKSQPPVSYM